MDARTIFTYSHNREFIRSLVEESHRYNLPILCTYSFTKESIQDYAKQMNMLIQEPFTIQERSDLSRMIDNQEVIIDDVYKMLTVMLYNNNIKAVPTIINSNISL